MDTVTKLVRSLRSKFAAISHEAAAYPVVVLPWPFFQFPFEHRYEPWPIEILDALSSENRIDALPVPFDRCVLLWECATVQEREGGLFWSAWVIEPTDMNVSGHQMSCVIETHQWARTQWVDSPILTLVERLRTSDILCSVRSNDWQRHISAEEFRAASGLDFVWWPWLVEEPGDQGIISGSLIDLEPLARLMSPCGYLVRSIMHEPYGPPALRDELWRQPFYTMINWDRLYRESEGGCGEHAPPRPHDRHGYVRRLWKQAGIDRRTLPLSVSERMRISEERKVPMTYVRPCKVRPAIRWFDGLAAHEQVDWAYDNGFRIFENDDASRPSRPSR